LPLIKPACEKLQQYPVVSRMLQLLVTMLLLRQRDDVADAHLSDAATDSVAGIAPRSCVCVCELVGDETTFDPTG